MAKQKKIMDLVEGGSRLMVYKRTDPFEYAPYRIYLVISATGAPIRKRLLGKYSDFLYIACFIRNFYLDGMNTRCLTDILDWVHDGWDSL